MGTFLYTDRQKWQLPFWEIQHGDISIYFEEISNHPGTCWKGLKKHQQRSHFLFTEMEQNDSDLSKWCKNGKENGKDCKKDLHVQASAKGKIGLVKWKWLRRAWKKICFFPCETEIINGLINVGSHQKLSQLPVTQITMVSTTWTFFLWRNRNCQIFLLAI